MIKDPTRAERDVNVTVATGVTQTLVQGQEQEQDTGEAHESDSLLAPHTWTWNN